MEGWDNPPPPPPVFAVAGLSASPLPTLLAPALAERGKVEMGSALSDPLWSDWPRLGSGRGREGTRLPKSNQGRTVT